MDQINSTQKMHHIKVYVMEIPNQKQT